MMKQFNVICIMSVLMVCVFGMSHAHGQTIEKLEIQPREIILKPGQKIRVSVFARYSDGTIGMPNKKIVLRMTGGEMDSTGLFTAGNVPGNYAVTAISGSVSDSVPFRVTQANSTPVRLKILTERPTLAVGQSYQFKAVGITADGREVPANVNWQITGGGEIDTDGKVEARQIGDFVVVARDADNPNNQQLVAYTSIKIQQTRSITFNPNLPTIAESDNGAVIVVDRMDTDPDITNNTDNNDNKNPDVIVINTDDKVNDPPKDPIIPASIQVTKRDIGGGNFFKPWARIQGKVKGTDVHEIQLVATDNDERQTILARVRVKNGSTFNFNETYERFDTDHIDLILIAEDGKRLKSVEVYR